MALSSEQFNRIVGNADPSPKDPAKRLMLPDGTFTVERRRETRMAFGQRAKIRLQASEYPSEWSTVMLQDISLNGISFLCDAAQAIDAPFILCLKDHVGIAMSIRCSVQRCEPGGFGGTSFTIGARFEELLPELQSTTTTHTPASRLADPFEACGPGTTAGSKSVPKKPRNLTRTFAGAISTLSPRRLWSHLTREYDDFSASGTGSKLPAGVLTEIAKTMEAGSTPLAPVRSIPEPNIPAGPSSAGTRRSSLFLPASTATEVKPMIDSKALDPTQKSLDYTQWARRDLTHKRYVYIWAAELNISAQPNRPRIMVLLGAPANGAVELIALHPITTPDPKAWKQLLANLMRRGLTKPPAVVIGDRSLGIWSALADFSPRTEKQFCWKHQIPYLLSLLPKGMQRLAEKELGHISAIPNRQDAASAIDLLIQDFQSGAPEAAQCLQQDKEWMLAFHSFPAADQLRLKTCDAIHEIFESQQPLSVDESQPIEATLKALLYRALPSQKPQPGNAGVEPLAA